MQRLKLRLIRPAICLLVSFSFVTSVAANRPESAQKQSPAKIRVSIVCDGAKRTERTTQKSVGAILKESGIELGPADIVHPNLNAKPTEGMEIRVVRVTNQTIVERLPTAYKTIRKPAPELRPGLVQVKTEGENGEKLLYYSVRYEDGTEVSRSKIRSEIVKPATDKVILIGQQGVNTSRGFIASRKVMKMQASAYDPGPRSCGRYATGRTAIGMRAGYGVVAVDPKVIPLRTRLYIEGYGFAIAGDTGRAIKGNRIDLGYDTYAAAKKFGRRTVTVHILH